MFKYVQNEGRNQNMVDYNSSHLHLTNFTARVVYLA